MKTYFNFVERPNGGWVIAPVHNMFCNEEVIINGSFNLLACRISGLSWPQWLRFCRQNGANLYGKNNKYIIAVWPEQNQSFLKKLNERANELAAKINLKELHY